MGHECKEYYKGKDGRIYERVRWTQFKWKTIYWGPRQFTGVERRSSVSGSQLTRRSDIIQRFTSERP